MQRWNSLVKGFSRTAEQFTYNMQIYQDCTEDVAEMPRSQISTVWDSAAAAVEQAIIDFSKEVKALQARNEDGEAHDENSITEDEM